MNHPIRAHKPSVFTQHREQILRWLVLTIIFTFLCSIVFNIRKTVLSQFAFFMGEKKDFTIGFLYFHDVLTVIVCISLLIFLIFSLYKPNIFKFNTLSLLLVAIISFLLNYNELTLPTISILYLLYIAKVVVLHETVKIVKSSVVTRIIKVVWVFGLFESIITIIQFSQQSSIGLRLLGEPIFNPYGWEVAKIEALGQVFSRPYGTFSHPNILSAFLLFSLMTGLFLYLSHKSKKYGSWIDLILLQLNLLALFLTFSRAAWLATAISTVIVVVFTWNIFGAESRKPLARFIATSSGLFITIVLIYYPFIVQRGNVWDKAYQERRSYNSAALAMIRDKPLTGLGPGESIFQMDQHLEKGSKPWEIQPIHNYYLLLASEIGLPGLLIFMYYAANAINRAIKGVIGNKKNASLKTTALLGGLVGSLVLMFFDHYFYTNQATTLIFWIWLGMLINTTFHVEQKTN